MHDSEISASDDDVGRLLEAAREAARREIGSDLHDGVLQPLMALVTSLEYVQRRQANAADAAGPGPSVSACLSLAREAASSLRFALSGLRVHPHAQAGLPRAIGEHLVPWLGEWGVRVQLDVSSWPDDVDVETTSALYLAVREALTNVWKHAGVGDAQVSLDGRAAWLRVSVRDQGVGIAASSAGAPVLRGSGWGLASMELRLSALGGDLTVLSRPGAGVLVQMRVPNPTARPTVKAHGNARGRLVSPLTH